ncbi:MAG TPA: acetyl-CoA carboxylase biotin carboxylase subunit, partial [Verrucomicrobiales bacterium]|nr:acetyl-CoA carboxylase biotin carboxylase subunit [Verrucomicrobiales bacterium]
VCESCNIAFIGPGAKVMNTFGDKQTSRELATRANVAVPPGSDGMVEDEDTARAVAKEIGYPVMIKAVAGGGGRGMRVAHNDVSLLKGFHTARTEAEKAFGNGGVYIEKFIENPRHIEYQILGDTKGNIIHLGERDCSIQRRNQKLIEETPSPLMAELPDLRQEMGEAALRIAHESNYVNAGTVEFVADDKGNYYFLEVNKRIQVEHPITEEVTGVDLVKAQIAVAMGETLRISQEEVSFTGHAIECRINAENPYADFAPSPGRVEMYYAPGGKGVRLDSHVYAGYTVPPHYDSMVAKLITVGKDRREAIARMSRALSEYMITGIKTTIPFELAIMRDPNFRRGVYATNFIENMLANRRELIERDA